jgi:hypothetical protein
MIEDVGAVNPFKRHWVEIRGRRAKTLPGHIQFRYSGGDSGNCTFWHMTRNPANDSLKKENEKKMKKYGYRADDEWNRKKLFGCSLKLRGLLRRPTVIEWVDDEGKIVATEEGDMFNVVNEVDQNMRDALITCWTARRWKAGAMNWQRGEMDLARAKTLNS